MSDDVNGFVGRDAVEERLQFRGTVANGAGRASASPENAVAGRLDPMANAGKVFAQCVVADAPAVVPEQAVSQHDRRPQFRDRIGHRTATLRRNTMNGEAAGNLIVIRPPSP